jgi:hypothetical protein
VSIPRNRHRPDKLTASFIGGSRRRFNSGEDAPSGGAMAMINPMAPRKSHPSLWAVALLFISTGFALLSVVLCSTGYSPH